MDLHRTEPGYHGHHGRTPAITGSIDVGKGRMRADPRHHGHERRTPATTGSLRVGACTTVKVQCDWIPWPGRDSTHTVTLHVVKGRTPTEPDYHGHRGRTPAITGSLHVGACSTVKVPCSCNWVPTQELRPNAECAIVVNAIVSHAIVVITGNALSARGCIFCASLLGGQNPYRTPYRPTSKGYFRAGIPTRCLLPGVYPRSPAIRTSKQFSDGGILTARNRPGVTMARTPATTGTSKRTPATTGTSKRTPATTGSVSTPTYTYTVCECRHTYLRARTPATTATAAHTTARTPAITGSECIQVTITGLNARHHGTNYHGTLPTKTDDKYQSSRATTGLAPTSEACNRWSKASTGTTRGTGTSSKTGTDPRHYGAKTSQGVRCDTPDNGRLDTTEPVIAGLRGPSAPLWGTEQTTELVSPAKLARQFSVVCSVSNSGRQGSDSKILTPATTAPSGLIEFNVNQTLAFVSRFLCSQHRSNTVSHRAG